MESFNGRLRDELLNREIFTALFEAKVVIEGWRREYNEIRPHSSLGYRPPAPRAKLIKALFVFGLIIPSPRASVAISNLR